MSDSNGSASSGGIGIIGALGIVFVTLKLTGHIDWHWAWVTLPFWGGLAMLAVILVAYGIGCGIAWLFGRKQVKSKADEVFGGRRR